MRRRCGRSQEGWHLGLSSVGEQPDRERAGRIQAWERGRRGKEGESVVTAHMKMARNAVMESWMQTAWVLGREESLWLLESCRRRRIQERRT